jgi:aryl-alcohol dehydrogenase-like predicted oxidoreductase
MNRISLGVTGLRVSRLAVGTAALGLDRYGFPVPGNRNLDRAHATDLIAYAAAMGVNLFDTAPGYGYSEELLGEALAGRQDSVVATKIAIPEDIERLSGAELSRRLNDSLEKSLRALRRTTLDIVQIHNATVPVLRQGAMIAALERAREEGKLRHIGASVYGEDAALAAIATGKIEVLQIAVSLLDQRMRSRVIPEAKARGVAVLARSALLKGALTEKAQWLPQSLSELTAGSRRALVALNATWETLPAIALRFCMSLDGVQAVLSGIRSRAELEDCMKAAADGLLSRAVLDKTAALALDDDRLLNPTYWKLEEIDSQLAQL